MCGIAGITRRIQDGQVEKVLSSLERRGPDGRGIYRNDDVTFLHSRLSIIDVDARSNQPMLNPETGTVIVFNGEMYNYKEIKARIKNETSYQFKTNSDTEVILAGYEVYGNKIWEMISGMFAAVIYDPKKNKTVLARDHAGIKPLYYYFDGENLTFSSEIKNIFLLNQKLSQEKSIDEKKLQEYFVLGYISSPDTLYTNIKSVERESFIEFSLIDKKLSTIYFQTEVGLIKNELGLVIEDSINDHLVSDVPVSLLFSGGTDSSLLASILNKLDCSLEAFTLFMPGRPEDREYSQMIAKHLQLRIQYFEYNQEAFEKSYLSVTSYLDVPLADISLFPTNYISSEVSKQYKVVLSGEGGDELFYGYKRHINLNKNNYTALKFIFDAYQKLPRHKGKGIVQERLLPYVDAFWYYALICSPELQVADSQAIKRLRSKSQSINPLDFDKDFYLENMLLKKLDLMTMKNSLEGRVPLLSPKIYAYTQSRTLKAPRSPIELKFLLKQELKKYLPENLVERKKTGFGFNPTSFIHNNEMVKSDYLEAMDFLSNFDLKINSYNKDWIYNNKPGLALAVVLLHKSIKNHSN